MDLVPLVSNADNKIILLVSNVNNKSEAARSASEGKVSQQFIEDQVELFLKPAMEKSKLCLVLG
jgi:hypothetical protein